MAQCQDPVDIKIHKELLLACGRGKEIDVHLLLQQGASIRVQDQDGRTCLHYAAGKGHKNILKILLDHKIPVGAKDKYESTPLHQACANGHEEIASFLISSGARADAEDEDGNTPLHTAAFHGCHRLIRLLTDSGAGVNACNKAGDAPLHIAARNNHKRCVLGLLKFGANLESVGQNGNTVLHLSIQQENVDLVGELLSFGADINVQNHDGNSPLQLCSELGNKKLTKLLSEQGHPFESSPNMVGDTAKDEGIEHEGPKSTELFERIPSPKSPNETRRRSKKEQEGKASEKSSYNEHSSPILRTRSSQRRRDKKRKKSKEDGHRQGFRGYPSLEKIIHSDSGSSTTSLWTPVDSSGVELPMDWYWHHKHPMSPTKKTIKQLNVESAKEDDDPSPTTLLRYAREIGENGRPARQHPRIRQRSTVLKGKKKKTKPQRAQLDTTLAVDSAGDAIDASDDKSDAAFQRTATDALATVESDKEDGEGDPLISTSGKSKTRSKKRSRRLGSGPGKTKGEKSQKDKGKDKNKGEKQSSAPLGVSQAAHLSPRVQGRSEIRKGEVIPPTKHNKGGEPKLKHWPEFQVNESDSCKLDPTENSIKTAAALTELASKPYAANFAFAIHRLEKTSIQFEKDLNHTRHDLEHKLHKLKKKLYDYMDVTDDRLDEAERCQDLYYHEIKEDLSGIKRSLEQQSRPDTTALMEQVKHEIDESMRKWYSKLESRTCYDSADGGLSSGSSKGLSPKKGRPGPKPEIKKNEASSSTGNTEIEERLSEEGTGSESARLLCKDDDLRSPPQGNSDGTPTSQRPPHPGDGDSSSVQKWYEVKLKDVENYWKAKSDEEHDMLKKRIKELEELLFKETGFHNTLV